MTTDRVSAGNDLLLKARELLAVEYERNACSSMLAVDVRAGLLDDAPETRAIIAALRTHDDENAGPVIYPYYTIAAPAQTPALPEVTDEDVDRAIITYCFETDGSDDLVSHAGLRAALKSYRARLMGGGR